jgi:hypothetical protein
VAKPFDFFFDHPFDGESRAAERAIAVMEEPPRQDETLQRRPNEFPRAKLAVE